MSCPDCGDKTFFTDITTCVGTVILCVLVFPRMEGCRWRQKIELAAKDGKPVYHDSDHNAYFVRKVAPAYSKLEEK